jgi:dimethylaniline monooxygenase (N-oxide forming)
MEVLMLICDSLLFFTAGISALNYGKDKFIKELHEGNLLEVHRASITSMTGSTVKLSNGESLPSDAAIFATGWDFKMTLFDPPTALEVGTTALLKDEDPENAAYWAKLKAEAEKEVFETLPILKEPPPFNQREVDYTPFRLYRHLLPSALAEKQDRSLIFLGLVTSVQTTIYAEVSALWGISWMEGLLDVQKSKQEMDYEIATVNSWCERRYLARGATRQIASVEIQQVTDLLMQDMGLKVYRKGNWFSETFVPIRSQDYKGIVQEMLAKSNAKGR